MRVLPAVVGREQVAQRGEQVVVAARPGLDDGYPGRRVRHEQLQQPVAAPGHELGTVAGEVADDLVVHGSPEQCRERIQAYGEAGITTPVPAILPVGVPAADAIRMLAPAND